MTEKDALVILLDTLLPGDGSDWPAAGQHGLADRTRDLAALFPGGSEALETILTALPKCFTHNAQDMRETQLKAIEDTQPEAFEKTVSAAYNAYYTDPGIRDIIERLTGYENRPPQPEGYDLPPFDESLLDQVKARGPIWREVPEE